MTQVAGGPAVDAVGVVAADVPCRRCEYDLRGLPVDGRCPECGTAVALSVRGDFLRFSDPKWVRSLRRGVVLSLCSMAVAVAAAVTARFWRAIGLGSLPGPTLGLAGSVLGAAGAWLVTTPDPGRVGADRDVTARRLIRVAAALAVCRQLSAIARGASAVPPPVSAVFAVAEYMPTAVGLAGTFATLAYLGRLARRLPDPALEARARTIRYGYGISLAVVAVASVALALPLQSMAAGRRPTGALLILGAVVAVALVPTAVYGIMYLVMLVQFTAKLAAAAAAADSTWTTPTRPDPVAAPPPAP